MTIILIAMASLLHGKMIPSDIIINLNDDRSNTCWSNVDGGDALEACLYIYGT